MMYMYMQLMMSSLAPSEKNTNNSLNIFLLKKSFINEPKLILLKGRIVWKARNDANNVSMEFFMIHCYVYVLNAYIYRLTRCRSFVRKWNRFVHKQQ